MNLNYYNVPVASNNPADDQPLMLTNTISINAILGIDHIPFNTNSGGRHRQVQLQEQSGIPAGLAAGFNTLYTKLAGSPAQGELFFTRGVSGDEVQITGNSTLSPNGYSVLPGGLIIQWGFVNSTSNGTVTFPLAFPTSVFTVTGQGYSGNTIPGGEGGISINKSAVSLTSFPWKFQTNSGSYTGFYWTALGN